jgi:nicotinamide mononucleotide adenylyltransferase
LSRKAFFDIINITKIGQEYMKLYEFNEMNVTVFYGGRFQPMHKGHYQTYLSLVRKFGADNVFISTTFGKKQQQAHDKKDYTTDPFTFDEKRRIINEMFGISRDHIVNTLPYQPDQRLVNRNPEEYPLILAFSKKDAGRLKPGNVFQYYSDDITLVPNVQNEKQTAYILELPVQEGGMSATDFRKIMSDDQITNTKKQKAFEQFFGKFNPEIFNFINGRLNG